MGKHRSLAPENWGGDQGKTSASPDSCGKTSASPDSCVFSHTENTKFLNLGYLVYLNNNLLTFELPVLCCKNSYIPWLFLWVI